MDEIAPYFASRYNFAVPTSSGQLLFNTKSGALIQLSGLDAWGLAELLSKTDYEFTSDQLGDDLFAKLLSGDFLVSSDQDELQDIRRRFWDARQKTPMVVTLTTTQDCNLGCYYCYEERTKDKLSPRELPSILHSIETSLIGSGRKSLHVDWYGGEPLLNIKFMEAASKAIQQLCARLDVKYNASIVSNGTVWPKNVRGFVDRHRIRQVQISFDGLKKNHDRRRRYRAGYAGETAQSSFEESAALVDELVNLTRVDIRFNVDAGNQGDIIQFLSFAKRRGWFDALFPAVFQPARLSSYSERSSFMRVQELSIEQFDEIRKNVRAFGGVKIEESEVPDGFPYPKTSVCAALALDSFVVGANGRTYRCGLQVGESHSAVGALQGKSRKELPVLSRENARQSEWWEEFDPTRLPNCSRCSFLPICWGGCPKKHLEDDRHAISEQSLYWRRNLPRLIANVANEPVPEGYSFPEALQFRE